MNNTVRALTNYCFARNTSEEESVVQLRPVPELVSHVIRPCETKRNDLRTGEGTEMGMDKKNPTISREVFFCCLIKVLKQIPFLFLFFFFFPPLYQLFFFSINI